MTRELFDRRRTRRESSAPEQPTSPSPRSSVEELWSSWRHEKVVARPDTRAPIETPTELQAVQSRSASPAERVNQLKRLGEYGQALQVALAEIRREEQGPPHVAEPSMVPWYYWEAAAIYRKLKRYNEEIALVRRFANNYGIHFRAFSKRYRSTRGASHAWATNFLERVDSARAAAAERSQREKE